MFLYQKCKACIPCLEILEVGIPPGSKEEGLFSDDAAHSQLVYEVPRQWLGALGRTAPLPPSALPALSFVLLLQASFLLGCLARAQSLPPVEPEAHLTSTSDSLQGKTRAFCLETFPFSWKE